MVVRISKNRVALENVPLNLSAAAINEARSNVAQHATTMDFWAAAVGNVLDGTGSALTITAIANAPQAGASRDFYPIVGTILTQGATFDIDGAVNRTAAAGEVWTFVAKSVSTYRVFVRKADGTAVVGSGLSSANQAELETATSTAVAVTPGRQQFHPSAAKSWVYIAYSAGVPSATSSYNVSSLSDSGVGICAVNLTNVFSSQNYAVIAGAGQNSVSNDASTIVFAREVTYFNLYHYESSTTLTDPINMFAVAFGDQ